MKLQQPIDAQQYVPRLWWLMLAGVAASFTIELPTRQAVDGFLFWLGALLIWALLRAIVRRGPHASARARRAGYVVAALGMAVGATRLNAREWLAAVPVLLLAVQAGAFIAAEKHLHVWLIMGAGFALLLCAALATHSPLYLVCATAFTLLALSVLALMHREQRRQAATFTAAEEARPGGGWLFAGTTLLLTIPGYLFVPKPGGNWFVDEVQATPAVLYPDTRLEPLAPPPPTGITEDFAPAPATAAPLEAQPRSARPESGDYGEEFSLEGVERRPASANSIVLHVRSSTPIYLRGKLYDRFAGNRWSRTLALPQRVELTAGKAVLRAPPAGPTLIEQSIDVALPLAPTLVHAPGVQALRFPAGALLRYEDGVLVALAPLQRETRYFIEARLALREGRYLLRELPPLSFAPYLQADAASPRLRELAQTLTANLTDPWDKALALEKHLRTRYQYSYATVARQNYTPLDWFLFEGRRGHCEYFASALAMMLRSVGIPARVATGFSLHDPNPITGFHEVRAFDGHAWVEAWLAGEGWVMLEPTPFYPLPRPEVERQIAEQMDGYLERLAAAQVLLDPGSFDTQLAVLMRDVWQSLRSVSQALTGAIRSLGWWLPLLFIAILAAVLGAYLLAVTATDWFDNLQIRRSLDALAAHEPRHAMLLLAVVLSRTMAPRRFPRRQDWTLREYAVRLHESARRGHGTVPLVPEAFIEAFDAARYGSPTQDVSEPVARVVDLVREQIRDHPWPRLRAAQARLQRIASRRLAPHRLP